MKETKQILIFLEHSFPPTLLQEMKPRLGGNWNNLLMAQAEFIPKFGRLENNTVSKFILRNLENVNNDYIYVFHRKKIKICRTFFKNVK